MAKKEILPAIAPILERLNAHQRSGLMEMYAEMIAARPTYEDFRKIAKRNPIGYIQGMSTMDKLSGMPQNNNIDMTIHHVHELSDVELDKQLDALNRKRIQEPVIDVSYETVDVPT